MSDVEGAAIPVEKSEADEATKPATAEEAVKPATAEEAAKPATAEEAAKPAPAEEAAKPATSEEAVKPATAEEAVQPEKSDEAKPKTEEVPPAASEEAAPEAAKIVSDVIQEAQTEPAAESEAAAPEQTDPSQEPEPPVLPQPENTEVDETGTEPELSKIVSQDDHSELTAPVPEEAEKLAEADAVLVDSLPADLSRGLDSPPPVIKQANGVATMNVSVEKEDGTAETLFVTIKHELLSKPFVGGWRHKESGKEYHNCSVQTLPKRFFIEDTPKNCRETQTVTTKNIRSQTTSDTSTQMTKTGCWVSDRQDKVIIPGQYVTADEKFSYMLKQVIVLQSYFRRWKAQKYVNSIRQDHIRRIEWEKKEEERKRKEKERRLKVEYQRRMQPLTKEDFDLVYHALELWRREEIENINATKSGPERKAALAGLMDEETQLIASIQRHKLIAKQEVGKRSKRKFLEKCAAPKEWIGFDGMPTHMDTPYTMRAKDLKMTYESLEKRYLTREERLDILLQLKLTVKEHDCKLTKDIVELIDREADLLMRGTKESNLEGLRQRISSLFLQYIKTPLFNAEAANLLRVPEDPSSLRKNIYYCRGCGNYLPSTDFELTTNARSIGRCRKCKNLDSEGRLREDFSRYRSLLHSIRSTEESYNDGSKIIFLLTEADLRYLAENIWGAQSVLSQWEDTYDLTLVRWNRRLEWSPWNCVLLTNEEARAHSKLTKPEEAYGPVFTQKIKYRHILGKQYFSSMPKLADYMGKNLQSVNMPLPSNAEKVMFGGKKKEEKLVLPPLTEAK